MGNMEATMNWYDGLCMWVLRVGVGFGLASVLLLMGLGFCIGISSVVDFFRRRR